MVVVVIIDCHEIANFCAILWEVSECKNQNKITGFLYICIFLN